MGADILCGQVDCLQQTFQSLKFQGSGSDNLTDGFHHLLIFLSLRILVAFNIRVQVVRFQFTDDAACDEVEIGLGSAEVQIWTSVA